MPILQIKNADIRNWIFMRKKFWKCMSTFNKLIPARGKLTSSRRNTQWWRMSTQRQSMIRMIHKLCPPSITSNNLSITRWLILPSPTVLKTCVHNAMGFAVVTTRPDYFRLTLAGKPKRTTARCTKSWIPLSMDVLSYKDYVNSIVFLI